MELTGAHIGLAIGLWLVAEGLVLALAPAKIVDILAAIASLSVETRRLIGLTAVAVGVLLIAAIAGWPM